MIILFLIDFSSSFARKFPDYCRLGTANLIVVPAGLVFFIQCFMNLIFLQKHRVCAFGCFANIF